MAPGSTASTRRRRRRLRRRCTNLAAGNRSNVEGVGSGVFERKIAFGPGYRIYFGKDGDSVIILLSGSTKQRKQHAIEVAKERWAAYRRRKGA